MVKSTLLSAVLLILFSGTSIPKTIKTGADRAAKYLPLLKGKRIGIVTNQSSIVHTKKGNIHLVDFLLEKNINLKKIFAPEHGFRGKADAGEHIDDDIDKKTGLRILSLYGKNKILKEEYLLDIDILLFDIQDVGVRFYTYISTLHYVMRAAAQYHKTLIVLDRPNPNGYYIDGPILHPRHQSFVGMHPVPVVYGMTIGEYAKMINGEHWLGKNLRCDLRIIKLKDYTRQSFYHLPIPPSPNLPSDRAINLYPSLCFFEGTSVSVGRGTDTPFEVYGAPFLPYKNYSFIPHPNAGSKYPKHQGEKCYGKNLTKYPKLSKIHLQWLLDAYKHTDDKEHFFNAFFKKLSGNNQLQEQIIRGDTENQIRDSWQIGLDNFKIIRKKYLLYDK